MLNRRTALAVTCATLFVVATQASVRHAWAQTGARAVGFIRDATDQLVAIVNASGSQADKRHQLLAVINATVDVNDIAQFCLGRFWRIATPDQRAEYVALFRELLVIEIGAHLGEYQGVRVSMGSAQTSADTDTVTTTVTRPNNPATQVDWVVSSATGGPKIVDLLAEGTSMRQTQSADFAAYLARHQYKIHELLEGMRQQIAQAQ